MELLFKLKQMSQAQRVCLASILAVIVLLILIHNPFSGYVIDEMLTTRRDLPACSESEKRQYKLSLISIYNSPEAKDKIYISNGDPDQLQKIITKEVEECHLLAPGIPTSYSYNNEYTNSTLDVGEWKSKDPLLSWLGKVVNLVGSIISVCLIGLIFHSFVFSKKDT